MVIIPEKKSVSALTGVMPGDNQIGPRLRWVRSISNEAASLMGYSAAGVSEAAGFEVARAGCACEADMDSACSLAPIPRDAP